MNKMIFGRDPEPDADSQHWINAGVVGSRFGTVLYVYIPVRYDHIQVHITKKKVGTVPGNG